MAASVNGRDIAISEDKLSLKSGTVYYLYKLKHVNVQITDAVPIILVYLVIPEAVKMSTDQKCK